MSGRSPVGSIRPGGVPCSLQTTPRAASGTPRRAAHRGPVPPRWPTVRPPPSPRRPERPPGPHHPPQGAARPTGSTALARRRAQSAASTPSASTGGRPAPRPPGHVLQHLAVRRRHRPTAPRRPSPRPSRPAPTRPRPRTGGGRSWAGAHRSGAGCPRGRRWTRPLGVIGHSAGGFYAALAMSLDPRLRVGATPARRACLRRMYAGAGRRRISGFGAGVPPGLGRGGRHRRRPPRPRPPARPRNRRRGGRGGRRVRGDARPRPPRRAGRRGARRGRGLRRRPRLAPRQARALLRLVPAVALTGPGPQRCPRARHVEEGPAPRSRHWHGRDHRGRRSGCACGKPLAAPPRPGALRRCPLARAPAAGRRGGAHGRRPRGATAHGPQTSWRWRRVVASNQSVSRTAWLIGETWRQIASPGGGAI